MNWNKLELYDDNYPWAIQSDDGSWIIAKDAEGNTLVFSVSDLNERQLRKFLPSRMESTLKLAKELCANGIESIVENS